MGSGRSRALTRGSPREEGAQRPRYLQQERSQLCLTGPSPSRPCRLCRPGAPRARHRADGRTRTGAGSRPAAARAGPARGTSARAGARRLSACAHRLGTAPAQAERRPPGWEGSCGGRHRSTARGSGRNSALRLRLRVPGAGTAGARPLHLPAWSPRAQHLPQHPPSAAWLIRSGHDPGFQPAALPLAGGVQSTPVPRADPGIAPLAPGQG